MIVRRRPPIIFDEAERGLRYAWAKGLPKGKQLNRIERTAANGSTDSDNINSRFRALAPQQPSIVMRTFTERRVAA
jgi:hypothetical protein